MGRRASGDYAGLWCIPCGYVEWDEDVREAAVREFEEETGVRVELGALVAVHSNFHNREKQTVGIWFEGRAVGGELHPVDGEFSELGWFAPTTPPNLAFPTDGVVLRELR
jgi:ADP-ribose pyrophosphatase YjhB (NUDIX family)